MQGECCCASAQPNSGTEQLDSRQDPRKFPRPGRRVSFLLWLRGTTDIDLADGHFAIRVSDFEGAVSHLRAHGVEVLELQQNPTAWKQVYFTDPDGNVIELNAERS